MIRPNYSIRFCLLLGFAAMVIVIGVLGIYGVRAIEAAGRIVVDTYDRPLMAINYARAASLDFAEMRNLLLKAENGGTASPELSKQLDTLATNFVDDMNVAQQRLLTARERALAHEIRDQVAQWNNRRLARGSADMTLVAELDALDTKITDSFDRLIEFAAESSFIERQHAVKAVDTSRSLALGATGLALLLAVTTALLLSRRVVRPLSSAAAIADRIADGELTTPIPAGRRDETGALLRSMAMMQDSIAQMVAREQAQKHSAQTRLVEALENAHEGMVLLDSGESLLLANSQLSQFFPEIAVRLVPGAHFPTVFCAVTEDTRTVVDHASDDGNLWMRLLCEGGEVQHSDGRWLRLSRTPTREGGWFLLFADITELKEREDTLRIAKQQAEAASEAKSRFLANMSHELRTPLNAVIGFAEIIAGELFGAVGNPNYRDYANDIMRSGQHLLAIINSVLDLAKSEANKLIVDAEPVALAETLSECATMVREQCAQAALTLTVGPVSPSIVVMGDPAKLRQIFLNLLSNAIKFSGPGGSVTVAVSPLLQAARVADRITVTVADTGIGMRPEDILIAMAPFGQVDSRLARRYEGTGLGLPLTQALVDAHRGRLEIDSAVGRGTAVSVTFPVAVAVSSERELLALAS